MKEVLEAVTRGVHIGQERDGRWVAAIPELPGAAVHGADIQDAVMRVTRLALRMLADQIGPPEPVEPTEQSELERITCAVADAWAHAAQKRMADYADLHRYAPGLPDGLDKIEQATRHMPFRKVRT